MTTFFTSDTHYGHNNILKYVPERAFDNTEDMDEALIDAHNVVVAPKDTVYHLGDFAFASKKRIKEILTRLNGYIYLLRGNHDRAFKGPFAAELLESGLLVNIIHANYEVRIGNARVVLDHYAHRVWNNSHHGAIHLYGHSHGSLPGLGKSVDVGVDSKEMGWFTGGCLRPWHEAEILKFMDSKAIAFEDHHNRSTT